MINITPICRKYGKLPSSFLSKKVCRGRDDISIKQGHDGYTKIPLDLAKEFFMWVSPITRQMLVDNVDLSVVVRTQNIGKQ